MRISFPVEALQCPCQRSRPAIDGEDGANDNQLLVSSYFKYYPFLHPSKSRFSKYSQQD